MTLQSIRMDKIIFDEIAHHGECIDNYNHNQTPILLISYNYGDNGRGYDEVYYQLLTGGHRYNSARASNDYSGMDEIDAYVIPDDKIDFNLHTIYTLWDINDEAKLIELLGEDNFE